MAREPIYEMRGQSRQAILAYYGTLLFHIETLEENEKYAEEHPNNPYSHAEPERLMAYRKKRDELRELICHGPPSKPAYEGEPR